MSNVIFEDRSTYDPAKDPVERLSVIVECAPGQADHIAAHLASVKTQAGVYCVTLNEEQEMPSLAERLEQLEQHVVESVGTRLMEFGDSIESLGARIAGIEEHPALSVPSLPAAAPVAEPELAKADAAETSSSVVAAADEQPAPQAPEAATDTAAPVDEAAAAAPTGNSDEQPGAPDGEQPHELADSNDSGTDLGGRGSVSEAGDTPAVGTADEDSSIPGTAGEVGAEPQ